MRRLLRALTLVSFAGFVGGAMVAFSQGVRPSKPDAGVDAGPGLVAIFGTSDRTYLAGSKSFGAPIAPGGLGGLGLRGLGARPDAGVGDAGTSDASVR